MVGRNTEQAKSALKVKILEKIMTKTQSQLKMIQNLYFVVQPIFNVSNENQVAFYELLLRSKVSNKFPGNNFFDLFSSEYGNLKVLIFFETELKKFLNDNPNTTFSINFEIIQFQYDQTITFFENMLTYSPKIIIEITERSYEASENKSILPKIQKIQEMGYSIFIDDIGTGRHTLSCVQNSANYIDGIKFSAVPFKNLSKNDVVGLLNTWENIAKANHLIFICEGVDNFESYYLLKKMGIDYQQGWYLGRPMGYTIEAKK
ncbi:EAL domain-containing protein [Leuconostoc litchii]|nr:EAL domain-containing protein [Leuconostoc litchii]